MGIHVSHSVKLDTDNLFRIDNRCTVHGWSALTPRYDRLDRWLQRSFMVRDLGESAGDRYPDERGIHTMFEERRIRRLSILINSFTQKYVRPPL